VTATHPGDRTYRNQTLRLTDLAVVDDVIEGVTFENCELVGPAVLALLEGTRFSGNTFAVPSLASALWAPQGQDTIVGAIGLRACTVIGCSLRRIGLAVLPGQESILRGGIAEDG
jgi:hypothetical protein